MPNQNNDFLSYLIAQEFKVNLSLRAINIQKIIGHVNIRYLFDLANT